MQNFIFLKITKKVSIFALLILLLTYLSIRTSAHFQEEETAVRISTELVQFDVIVQDKKGNIVKNLKPEDFEIYENKELQEITNFSFVDLQSKLSQSNPKQLTTSVTTTSSTIELPNKNLQSKNQVGRTIAIVVDEIAIPIDTVSDIRSSLKKFIDSQMLPTDLVAIIRTGASAKGLQQFTSNKQLLYAAIQEIKGNITNLNRSDLKSVPNLQIIGVGSETTTQLVSFQTSVSEIKFVIEALRQMPGRKSVVLFSAEFPGNELANLSEARQELNNLIEIANRSSVVFYTNDVRGNKFLGVTAGDNLDLISSPRTTQNEEAALFVIEEKPEMIKRSQQGLRTLASATNGIFTSEPETGIKTALNDQQGYYLIGYTPREEVFSNKNAYHKLSVKVKKSGLTVRTRNGFYAIDDKEFKKITPEEELLKAAISPFNTSRINVELTPVFTHSKTEGNILQSTIHIDCPNLSFVDQQQTKKLSLETLIYIFSQNGDLVNQITHKNNITIPTEKHQSLLDNGFAFSFNTIVKTPGTYQLRVVVRDAVNNNLGTAGQLVFIPDVNSKNMSLSGIILADELNLKADTSTQQSALLALAKRKFKSGATLQYNCHIYNPTIDSKTKTPNLKIQTTIYKDSKKVFSNDFSLETKAQENFQDFPIEGKILLKKDLSPGKYIFQFLVTDLANKKHFQTQEIDFEISE